MKYRNLIRFSNGNILKVDTLWFNFVRFAKKTSVNNIKSLQDGNTTRRLPGLMDKYLQDNNINVKDVSNKYLILTSKTTGLYLINPEVAKEFVSLIKDDLLENATYVIESNPGLGLLTQELLKIGVPFIHLYETDDIFHKQLETLQNEFPERLSVQYLNLLFVSRLPFIFWNNSKLNVYDIFKNVPQRKWEEESRMQIIGTVNDFKFVRHLVLSTVFQTCLMVSGRTIFYLAMPTFLFNILQPKSNINTTHILFQILFNCKVFGTVDEKAYVPWRIYKKRQFQGRKRLTYYNTKDNGVFYIVKLEPKREIFKIFKKKEDIIFFWHFVRHNCYRSSSKVIPALEKIIPGCGIRLIAMGYNIFTRFNDLTAEQIYELFVEFRSWPEFGSSTFTASANDTKALHDAYNIKGFDISHSDDHSH